MRGVSLRGRRLPTNRSAGPARPPVVPAAVPRRSPHGHAVSGFAAAHRTVPGGPYLRCAARRSITTRHSAAHESAARRTRFARGPPARWHPVEDRDNDNRPGIGQQSVTCTDRPCHRQPSGVSAVPRDRRRASPHCSCPRRHLADASPAATRALPGTPSAHPVPGPAAPRKPACAGPRGSMPRHRVKPCPPPISHRFHGAVATA